jgi:hypothetical protein
MSLPSATLALLTSLLIVGCATKEPPPTAAQTQPEKKAGGETARHPDPSGGAMSGSEWKWSNVNPRHGGFQ